MSDLTTLARPYAVAAFKRAKESGRSQEWADEFGFLSALMRDERMQRAVSNPRAKRDALAAAFLGLCEGRLSQEGENLVRLLIRNQRLGLVGSIADLFEEYRSEDEGYVDVSVSSAFELSEDELKSLTATLEQNLGKQARLNVTVDENLIGGVYIRAGDRVIDASVRGQLERLAKRLWN